MNINFNCANTSWKPNEKNKKLIGIGNNNNYNEDNIISNKPNPGLAKTIGFDKNNFQEVIILKQIVRKVLITMDVIAMM